MSSSNTTMQVEASYKGCHVRREDGVQLEGEIVQLPEKYRTESVYASEKTGGFLLPNFYDGSVSLYDVEKKTFRCGIVSGDEKLMALGVAAKDNLVFIAGGMKNPALRVYDMENTDDNGGATILMLRDALNDALVNDVIADDTYAYFTDSNNPVVYRLNYRAAAAAASGASGSSGHVGEGATEDLEMIELPEKEFKKRGNKACGNGIGLYAGGVIVSNSATRTLYFIQPPAEPAGKSVVYAIMPEDSLPAADGIFIDSSPTSTSDATIYITQPRDNSIAQYTLTTTSTKNTSSNEESTPGGTADEEQVKVEAHFVTQFVCDDFVTPTSIALANDVMAAPNFNLDAPPAWTPDQSFSLVVFSRTTP